MIKVILKFCLVVSLLFTFGCGLKVVDPNEKNKNEGALALDLSGGQVKLVNTYTCNLESHDKRFSVVGKTEELARAEVVAKCKDHTAISFCDSGKITCFKN